MPSASETRVPPRSFLAYLATSDLRPAISMGREFPLSRRGALTSGGALFVRRLYRVVGRSGRKPEPRRTGRTSARRIFYAYRFKSVRRDLHDGDFSGGLERPQSGDGNRLFAA